MQHYDQKHKKLFETVGKIIRQLRLKKGLSVNLLAYENDLQKSMISRLENGHNEAKLASLWKISEALNIKLSDLIKEIESELPDDFYFIEK